MSEEAAFCAGCGSLACTGACGRADVRRFCILCGRRLVTFATPGWITWRCPSHPERF